MTWKKTCPNLPSRGRSSRTVKGKIALTEEMSVLREFTTPARVNPPVNGSVVDYILDNARLYPQMPIMSIERDGAWHDVTSVQFLDEVRALAKGLIASGLEAGQRIAIMSRTRYEWTLLDYAVWYAGAISVPVYETSSAEQLEWILTDSGAVAIVTESLKNKRLFDEVASRTPDVRNCWVIESDDLSRLNELGMSVSDETLEDRRATLNPDSIATLIYTSGTTGRPKGCVLTHKNFMFEVQNVVQGLPDVFLQKDSSTLLFLPIAHVFGRAIQHGCVLARVRMGHSPDITNLLPSLATFKPTFLLAVPRVFEKVYNSSQQKAVAAGKGHIFDTAAQVAIDYSTAKDTGRPGILLSLKHKIFDKLVYSKIRLALGGQVEWAISGGAPLGTRLGHFYRGIGITILEGYGLTETSAAVTVNRPDALRIGSVGQPIPGTTGRVGDDGELLWKGAQVFPGYWNNPAATAEVIDSEGWFHSGDLGEIDDDGFVRITGRKKEILVTAGGKNVAPAVLEDRIRAHWLVSQCMVVGDAQPYIAALVTIDRDMLPAWLNMNNLPADTTLESLINNDQLRASVQEAIDDANKAVSQAEAIKKFAILPVDWTEAGGQLTAKLSLKRGVVMQESASEVAALYS